ncbi:MAG: hypothetical protein L0338_12880 [Acidobacteria bacterium]|nr:hypothetical protein [Acidobacteriota bacterium]
MTVVASAAGLGLLVTNALTSTGAASTAEYRLNVFYYLFARNEPPVLVIVVLMAVISPILLRNPLSITSAQDSQPLLGLTIKQLSLAASAITFFLTLLGTHVAFHDYPLSMDEYMADFQAIIFSHGRLAAVLESPWRQFAEALTPTFCTYDTKTNSWISAYLPVYAALRSLFWTLRIPSVTNPLLAAASVLVMAKCAQRILPDSRSVAVAVLLLVTSSQFLITSMTAYSMPAHLLLNLIWLLLYSRNDRLGYLLAPWIGALALGLHNPFVHATFVAPFLVRILLRRDWRVAGYFAMVYGAACLCWLSWMSRVYPASGRPWSQLFELPGQIVLMNQSINLILLVTWQSFALVILSVYTLLHWGELSLIQKDLVFSFLVTFLFYSLFNAEQGHGWGYRYAFGTLGNLVLIAASAWQHLEDSFGSYHVRRWLLFCSTVALVIQLTCRWIQVEHFTAPFARAHRYLQGSKETTLVLDHRHVWYSRDLVRNDPFLRGSPKIMLKDELGPSETQALAKLGSVREVHSAELVALGMHPCRPPTSTEKGADP